MTTRRTDPNSGARAARLAARRAALPLGLSFLLAALSSFAAARTVSDESDVRETVERAFSQLKGGDYSALYDVLPTASQKRITRERFASALERTRGMYALDRLEIGAVHVAGDLAAVDSVVYGRALAPFDADGKIVLRQYLVREGGRWRVTTGDAATIKPLLSAHPDFARRYPQRPPQLYVKREGRWVRMDEMMRDARRRAGVRKT
ncbi:MAG: hypothetical protein LC746_03075 [Acidobacteria bacterium]|nr:hypothetical protein [Acidobacteriota bacterium]